jgi:2,5-furandicarboxylate decarboxylase 1
LEDKLPGEFVRVSSREVDSAWEISGLIRRLEAEGKFPAVLFDKVRGKSMPVLSNLFASRGRLALALEAEETALAKEYRRRDGRRIEPVTCAHGPVKEKVLTGDQVDLSALPIVTHCEKDAGPYITAGITFMRDPDTGISNAGIYRIMYKGPRKLAISMDPGSHAFHIFQKCEQRGENLDIAVVIGHHPAFYMACTSPSSLEVDEMDMAGGLMGEPVELTDAQTVDIKVPARAELIIEGRILAGVYEDEAPFGEFSWHYGPAKQSPIMEVTGLMSRADPIYLDIHSPSADHLMVQIPAREAALYRRVSEVVPALKEVFMPEAGCNFVAFLQIKKEYDGQSKLALLAGLSSPLIKLVVVVDEDVNVFDPDEVLWAIATRSQGERGLVVSPETFVCLLDPSAYSSSSRNIKGAINTRMGIDATWPTGFPRAERCEVDPRWKGVKLGDYLD